MQINGLDSAIELELKSRKDIENCPEGAVVMIHDYVGRFVRMHNEGVKIKSITRKMTIWFGLSEINQYWQQIKR